MQVSLRAFKKVLTNAKKVVSSGGLEGGLFIQLRAANGNLWVGGRGDAVSYTQCVKYEGPADFDLIYLSITSIDSLMVKVTKDDVLVLTYDGSDLWFETALENGVIHSSVVGVTYADPYTDLSSGVPYMLLRSGRFLAEGIKHASNVKTGWKVSNRPYPAGFIRLVTQEETSEQLCQLLLDDVTADQDRAVRYLSGMALSVFASDELRYFQTFEPVYERGSDVVSGIERDSTWIGKPLLFTLDDADVLSKLLEDETYRVAVLIDNKIPEALMFFNKTSRVWVRLYRGKYPDFNQQISFFHGDPIATFTPDKSFITSVKAAIKLPVTGEHGLTVRVGNGTIFVSSPEDAGVVRYGEVVADVKQEALLVVSGTGFLSAIDTDKELTLVAGEDFLAIYNSTERKRVILRQFTR